MTADDRSPGRPKVVVVMPAYNAEKFINEAIESERHEN